MRLFGTPFPSLSPVARLAWGALAYTVLVILWGAVVRATGAGAGCGAHWPLCNGEVVPSTGALNTLIEFGHRVTSGLALPLVVWLAWRVFRATSSGAAVRKAAVATVIFMLTEAAIGAGLVLLEYVAYNPSIMRAVWMAAHLTNTFLLLGALTLTAWWASGGRVPQRAAGSAALSPGPALAVGAALAAVLVLGAGGAVTALGDTLVLGGGLDPATDPVVALLVSARVFHPAMAFVALALVAAAVWAARPAGPLVVQRGMLIIGGFVVQMAVGALNVWLLAPIWLQVVHLLVTDLIWIAMVVFASEALAARRAVAAPAAVPA